MREMISRHRLSAFSAIFIVLGFAIWLNSLSLYDPSVDALPNKSHLTTDGIWLIDQVEITGTHADGNVFYHNIVYNTITAKGKDWVATQVGSGSGIANGTRYMALSNDGTAPSTSDTSCPSEITSNGLSRAQTTYAHTTGTNTFTESKTFTASGTQSVQKMCLLTNPTAGSSADYLYAEATFTSASMISGDTLALVHTTTMS